MWKGGKRKVRTERTYGFAVSRANPARNVLGVCPAHQKTNIPGFRPRVPVFRYAESIPNVSGALRATGEPVCCVFMFAEVAETRAPALRPSAFGCSRCATTSFFASSSLPRRRATLRRRQNPYRTYSPPFPPVTDLPRRPAHLSSRARTTASGTTTTRPRVSPARPFKLGGLENTSNSIFGGVEAVQEGCRVTQSGKSPLSFCFNILPLPRPPGDQRHALG